MFIHQRIAPSKFFSIALSRTASNARGQLLVVKVFFPPPQKWGTPESGGTRPQFGWPGGGLPPPRIDGNFAAWGGTRSPVLMAWGGLYSILASLFGLILSSRTGWTPCPVEFGPLNWPKALDRMSS